MIKEEFSPKLFGNTLRNKVKIITLLNKKSSLKTTRSPGKAIPKLQPGPKILLVKALTKSIILVKQNLKSV